MEQRPVICAFGSGKGGVGRSLIAANVAVALARRGRRAILLDADFGGANLHTLLGGIEAERTLPDFLAGEVERLEEVLAATSIEGLELLSGARALLDSPHLEPSRQRELLRQVAALDADVVLLDLAAGSPYHALDFFLAADEKILVVVPEPTSVENAYHFLKAAFHRRLEESARRAGVDDAMRRAMRGRARGMQSPRQLIAGLSESDPAAGRELRRQAADFRPRLIVNQVRHPSEAALGKEMALACRDYLGVEARYLGAVAYDDAVRRALKEQRPAMELFPTSPFSTAISKIASRLLEPEKPAAPPDLYSEDFRILGLEPGCRLTDVIAAHKRLKELYSQPSLATYSEADDERRAAMLERIEQASRRILREVSGTIPLAGT